MTSPAHDPETLLFTDRDGERGQLQDIIDDGLEGGYEDRVPALVQLMGRGQAEHRLWACAMLVSWGHEEGFDTLVAWARDPDSVPWRSGRGLADLADAVRTSYYSESAADLAGPRRRAVVALLRIADRQFVGRGLAVVLSRDAELRGAVDRELRDAIDRGLGVLAPTLRKAGAGSATPGRREGSITIHFDLALQVAGLLMPLAMLDDLAAATYADRLLDIGPRGQHVLAELADALGEGSGPATLDSLDRLASRGIAGHVEKVLERRRRAAASQSS